jgi:predicted esterase
VSTEMTRRQILGAGVALGTGIMLGSKVASVYGQAPRGPGNPPSFDGPSPEPGPKGTGYKLTMPKQNQMIADGVFYCWIPEKAETVRCVIVHLHGCTREGDAPDMVRDLQWRTLAKKYNAAFVAPGFTTGGNERCSNWMRTENGSEACFMSLLEKLAEVSKHPEIKTAPWALWGHSGGSFWVTSMTGKHPERAAVTIAEAGATAISGIEAALKVPILHHNGRLDVVYNKDEFLKERAKNALTAYAINPDVRDNMDGHQVHDLRLLALPWLDTCLGMRLPEKAGDKLKEMDTSGAWLGDRTTLAVAAAADFKGDKAQACWFPTKRLAEKWAEYCTTGTIIDPTPPPAPYDLAGTFAPNAQNKKVLTLTWNSDADIANGIRTFSVFRNSKLIRILRFDNRSAYSPIMGYQRWNDGDQATPASAPAMTYTDEDVRDDSVYTYEVSLVNWSNVTGPRSNAVTLDRGQVKAGKA